MAVVRKISADVRDVVLDPDVTKSWAEVGIHSVGSTPEEFAAMLEVNLASWKKIIGETGLRATD